MRLLKTFLNISNELTPMFSQKRTAQRATRLLLSNLLCIGRHWLTRMLCATNRDQLDWSGDYRLFSRSPWKTQDLFEPAIRRSLDYLDKDDFIIVKFSRPSWNDALYWRVVEKMPSHVLLPTILLIPKRSILTKNSPRNPFVKTNRFLLSRESSLSAENIAQSVTRKFIMFCGSGARA